jgi:hypothetical protein
MVAFAVYNGSLCDPLPVFIPSNRPKGCKLRKKRGIRSMKKQNIHYSSLSRFFDKETHYNYLYNIVQQKSLLSLRLLEFICTTLSREGIIVTRLSSGEKVYLDAIYQDKMDSHGKQLFDPFRRNPNSKFTFCKFKKVVDTNIAQLRFFQFVIEYGVIAYAENNFRSIELKMSRDTAKKKTSKLMGSPKPQRKRKCKPHVYSEQVQITFSPVSSCKIKRITF